MPVFETPEPILVTVDLPHGNLRVVAATRTDTCVTVTGGGSDTEPNVRVELVDGELTVKGPPQRRLGWALDRLRNSAAVDVRIELPAGSRIRATLSAGEYRCQGRLGECRLTTSYGDIRVEDAGPLHLATTYGEVHVDRAAGHAELSTGAGDIRVRLLDGTGTIANTYGETRLGTVTGDLEVKGVYGEVRIGRADAGVTARTAYGSIRIDDVARGVVDLATTSGALTVGIRAGSAAWLDVTSASGRIHNTLDTRDSPDGFTDTVEIRARTNDGTIEITRA